MRISIKLQRLSLPINKRLITHCTLENNLPLVCAAMRIGKEPNEEMVSQGYWLCSSLCLFLLIAGCICFYPPDWLRLIHSFSAHNGSQKIRPIYLSLSFCAVRPSCSQVPTPNACSTFISLDPYQGIDAVVVYVD